MKPQFINDETAGAFLNANPEGHNQYSGNQPLESANQVGGGHTKAERAYHKSDAASEASEQASKDPTSVAHKEAAYQHDVAADAHHAAKQEILKRAATSGQMSAEDMNEVQKHDAAIQRHEKEMSYHRNQAWRPKH